MRDVFAPDVRFVDRRLIGWGELEGVDTWLELVSGAVALAPDLHVDATALAIGSRGLVFRSLTRGHLEAGGGEVEIAS